jgi:hypothetical protein
MFSLWIIDFPGDHTCFEITMISLYDGDAQGKLGVMGYLEEFSFEISILNEKRRFN